MLLNETIVVLREQWGVSFPLVSQTSKDDTYANGGGKSDKCKINIALCILTLAPEWRRVKLSAKNYISYQKVSFDVGFKSNF
mgnify:FL=1